VDKNALQERLQEVVTIDKVAFYANALSPLEGDQNKYIWYKDLRLQTVYLISLSGKAFLPPPSLYRGLQRNESRKALIYLQKG
jgi:hypothetical protein